MKRLFLPLLFLFIISAVNAQPIADGGGDRLVCSAGVTLTLGGNPTASGGTPPYTYSWSSQAGFTSTQANPVAVINNFGTYTVIVTDNNGLKDTSSFIITMSHPSPQPFASDTIICNQQPVNFFVATNGGTPPYTYSWNFNDGGTSTLENPIHVFTTPGTYTVFVQQTDSNGCYGQGIVTVHVGQLAAAISTNNVTCAGGSDGVAQAIATGANPPFTYFWSAGMVGQTATNLPTGTYSVTVSDQLGCSASAIGIITEPTPLTANTTVVNESANGACDGSVVTTVSGGIPPYTFVWSNNATTATITNLCVGGYNVTIVDANGCTANENGIVGGACPNNTLVASISSQDLSCAHYSDTMVANVSGGTPPYTFFWNVFQNTQSVIVWQAGVYIVAITDSQGCTKTVTDTLLNTGVEISLRSAQPLSCNGLNNGYIAVNVSGGTAPYTYLWSNGGTTDSIGGIPSANYQLTVTDASLCSATFSYYLGQNSTNWSYYVYINSSDANCNNNGSASVVVNGGTGPFSYLWDNSSTTSTISNLSSGTYSVTVTGIDGCTRTGNTFINSACYSQIKGFVFNDVNGNCVKDSGEAGLSNISVTAFNNPNYFYGYTAADGSYSIHVTSTGNYTVNISGSWGSGCSNVNLCGAQTATVTTIGDTSTVNLGLTSSSGYDLALHPGWHAANPGFTKDYWVLYFQKSYPVYTGPATIVFKYDSILIYQSCNNSGVHNATAHTITWTVNNVPYGYWDWGTVPRAYFTVPANTPVGYQLSQEFTISPTANDCDTSDNHLLVMEPVTGSRDPNEKEVLPAGDILEEDSVLTYTIHFQNTGNDTTWFITIKDTLSPSLNPASVVNLASSHDYASFTISEKGILTWLFNPIFLVDSATNEPASKGFIKFKVKKRAGLPLNTQITNRASIYFDYNEPIVTNTVSNKITIPDYIFGLSNEAKINVSAAPNPFSQRTVITVTGITGAYNFELFDVNGKLLQNKANLTENRFDLNREGMSAGIYFYSVTSTTKQKAYGRLVIN